MKNSLSGMSSDLSGAMNGNSSKRVSNHSSGRMSSQVSRGNKIEYVGLFVDREELFERLRKVHRTPLACACRFPHVTFAYHPKQLQEELFGIRAEIVCVGYGCDGDNEGLKVALNSECADLAGAFQRIAVPHITLSLSETGKAVDTKNLEFHSIPPFTVSAVYGGFLRNGRVITVLPL